MQVGQHQDTSGLVPAVVAKGDTDIVAAGVNLAGAGGQDGAQQMGTIGGGDGFLKEEPDMAAPVYEGGERGVPGGGGGYDRGDGQGFSLATLAVVVATSGHGHALGVAQDDGPGACPARVWVAQMVAEIRDGEGVAGGGVAVFAVALGAVHEGAAGSPAGGNDGIVEGLDELLVERRRGRRQWPTLGGAEDGVRIICVPWMGGH